MPERCGNGVVDTGSAGAEQCDDGVQNNDSEADACRTNCLTAFCGDGVVDSAEECDDGASNSDVLSGFCRTDCTAPRCGDGVVDVGEACDPLNDAACTASCEVSSGDNSAEGGAQTQINAWLLAPLIGLLALRRRRRLAYGK